MAIADDVAKFEQQLNELILKYEQYFIGIEKREPLTLLSDIEKMIRRYTGVPINNTMYKHRFNNQVARFNTYREHWNRILKLIEEGRYSRDRFISDLHLRNGGKSQKKTPDQTSARSESEVDQIFHDLHEARKACNLPVNTITRDFVVATLDKQRPLIAEKLGTDNITFRVVIEGGKPKLKAGLRK